MKPCLTYSFVLLLLFCGCKKETIAPPVPPDTSTTDLKPGLPAKPDSIHGYFFSGYSYVRVEGGTPYETITCLAEFIDPAGNLLADADRRQDRWVSLAKTHANVGMGDISYNDNDLNFYQPYTLVNGSPSLVDQRARWKVTGNKVIPGFEQELVNEFPKLRDTMQTLKLHAAQGFTLNVSDHFDGWDSVIVKLNSHASYYSNFSTNKTAGSKGSVFMFSPQQLDFLPDDPNGEVLVRAFRYFHRNIQGRRYVFELSSGVQIKVVISR